MSFPWHHPNISRLRAEQLLLSSDKNGAFIIRDSETLPNAHVLCLLHEGRIHHYRILRDENSGSFFMQAVPGMVAQVFTKLEHLVTFYSQANQGLPCELALPVASQGCNSITDDDTDDEDDDVDETDGKQVENDYEFPPQIKCNIEGLESERHDKSFSSELGLYLGDGLRSDMETAKNGGTVLEGMQNLLASTSTNLITELQLFLSRVNMLQTVFSIGDEKKLRCPLPEHSSEEKPSFKLLMDLLAESIAGAKSLQTQALDVLKEIASINQEEDKEPKSRIRTFEVMTQGIATSKNKQYILVNYAEGKISFLKSLSEPEETSNTADQSKVVQLVKSKENIKRLRIKMESKPAKDFEFDDGKSREVFCQLVQQMKNQNAENRTKNQASVFIGTWNMGNTNPPGDLKSWFKCQGSGKTMDTCLAEFSYDIYAIGTQECPVGEKDWAVRIKEELKRLFPKDEFYMVGVCTLWNIRLVIFAKQSFKHMITHVQQSSVKTGIANALGNKGGVGISFSLGPLSLCFVNCHLAARSSTARVLRRNQNFLDILNGLNLGQKGVFGITHQFHHVFWFGDLNYRIDLDVKEVLGAVQNSNFGKMKTHDQLKIEREKENVFLGFDEDSINFAPTYRYKRGSNEYIWEKVKRSGVLTNVPSWCDRVLRHSFPQTKISCTSYGCTAMIRTSDHWPVFCSFDVSLPFSVSPDQSIPKSPASAACEIVFHKIVSKIKTNSRTQFYVEFHSTCLEDMVKTKKNNVLDSGKKYYNDGKSSGQYSYPEWNRAVIPSLHPIIADHDYLAEQHLLLAIKSVDNDESYGECCIALRTMINVLPQKCEEITLSHLGERTGEIMVEMHVKLPDDNNIQTSPRPFDLISIGDFEEGKGTIRSNPVPKRKSVLPQADSPLLPEKQGNCSADNRPAIPKRHSIPVPESPKASKGPPPLPVKKSKPRTVQEIMDRIGFSQYTANLLNDGWDELEFLNDLAEADLEHASIPKEHHKMILGAIRRYIS